jgi:hypothetical protein
MANKQRIQSDMATTDRREVADKLKKDNRIRNDELTIERRSRADKFTEDKRARNDDMTADRRRANDRNPWRTFTIYLLIILIILGIGAYYFF